MPTIAVPDRISSAARPLDIILPLFTQLAAGYALVWKLPCALADAHGYLVAGSWRCQQECRAARNASAVRRRAIAESVRWGEPAVLLCPQGNVLWAVPVMENALVTGG